MPLPERIEEIARPVVESHDAYIIDVKVRGESGAKIAELFVDTDEGVTTGLCERISKELSGVLDAAELFPGSSPKTSAGHWTSKSEAAKPSSVFRANWWERRAKTYGWV